MPETRAGDETPLLFRPMTIRGVTTRNRLVLAPMCQYSATDGIANEWHLMHLGRVAAGGMGIVMAEATAVDPRGRITHGDLGIWSDAHVAPLRRIADFVRAQGAVPAIQLAHAGRKASAQRPWQGGGQLGAEDAARGEPAWRTVAPSAEPVGPGWETPEELSAADIAALVERFGDAAARAAAAGFDVAEIHGAHGYLIASFMSPVTNRRNDAYGGDRAGRMRFALEVTEAVRRRWPADKPLFFRVSTVDGAEGGWDVPDTVALARELGRRGVDVVDCSSGGLTGSSTLGNTYRGPGFQVPYAAAVRREAGVASMAVGLILDGRQAEAILRAGDADLIAIGRQALDDPNFAHHAARELAADPAYAAWPDQTGFWLEKRERALERLGPARA